MKILIFVSAILFQLNTARASSADLLAMTPFEALGMAMDAVEMNPLVDDATQVAMVRTLETGLVHYLPGTRMSSLASVRCLAQYGGYNQLVGMEVFESLPLRFEQNQRLSDVFLTLAQYCFR